MSRKQEACLCRNSFDIWDIVCSCSTVCISKHSWAQRIQMRRQLSPSFLWLNQAPGQDTTYISKWLIGFVCALSVFELSIAFATLPFSCSLPDQISSWSGVFLPRNKPQPLPLEPFSSPFPIFPLPCNMQWTQYPALSTINWILWSPAFFKAFTIATSINQLDTSIAFGPKPSRSALALDVLQDAPLSYLS